MNGPIAADIDHTNLREALADEIERIGAAIDAAARSGVAVTVLALPRHGFATTRVVIERFFESAGADVCFVYLDVVGPPAVKALLEELRQSRPDFHVLEIGLPVSRQAARLLLLERISTPYVLFLDNNVLLERGCVGNLVAAASQTNAAVVSPVIVMQGGNMHFSGARIEQRADGTTRRVQTTRNSPPTRPLDQCRLERLDIDFAESHCCLMRTDVFRGRIDRLFPLELHNAHTVAYASEALRSEEPGVTMLVEPTAVASILPVAFGYDLPWLFDSYNDLERFRESYERHAALVASPSTRLGNLRWHRRHLIYLLLTMVEGNRLQRTDLLTPDEIPDYVHGYDKPLPDDAVDTLERRLMPFVAAYYSDYALVLDTWLYRIGDVIDNIHYYSQRGGPGRRLVPQPIDDPVVFFRDGEHYLYAGARPGERIRASETAAAIWTCCDGANTELEIEKAMVGLEPGNAAQIVAAVRSTLERFRLLGIIRSDAPSPTAPPPRRLDDLDTVVINRDADSERWRRARDQLEAAGVEYRRLPAVDRESLGAEHFEAFVSEEGRQLFASNVEQPRSGSLNRGSLAAALSWRRVFLGLRPTSRPVLVLEDDFVLCDDFRERLESCLPAVPADFHLVYLSWNRHEWINAYPVNESVDKLVRRVHGLGGVILNPCARDALLSLYPLARQLDHDLPDRLIVPGCVSAYRLTNAGVRLIHNDNLGGSRTQR